MLLPKAYAQFISRLLCQSSLEGVVLFCHDVLRSGAEYGFGSAQKLDASTPSTQASPFVLVSKLQVVRLTWKTLHSIHVLPF